MARVGGFRGLELLGYERAEKPLGLPDLQEARRLVLRDGAELSVSSRAGMAYACSYGSTWVSEGPSSAH